MRTKCGLWLTCPFIGEPLRLNGSLRGRRTLIVVLLSTKLELSQKGFQLDKLEPKSEKCVFIEYPKETVGYTFYHRSEGKIFVAKFGSFLEKEFLSKEVSGRKLELDEIIVSTPLLESSSSQEPVPVTTTPISEEDNDIDHETSDQVATEPRRSTRA